MTDLAKEYLVLWASQTGNAEWIAKNIHIEATKKGYTGQCFVMDDFAIAPLQQAGVIIMVSSNTGDGDAPDNALKFWRFLRRNKDKTYLTNTKYTILGLGDSNYSNFNYTAQRLEKKFKELGATSFYEKGLADDAEGLENTVDPWIEKLWEVLPTVLKQNTDLSVEDAVEAEKELEKQMTELQIEPDTVPFSKKNREDTLPEAVEKYTTLDNTLVDNFTMKKRMEDLPAKVTDYTRLENSLVEQKSFKKGSPLEISLAGLETGAKLTGLPRISVPVAKLTKLDGKKVDDDTKGKVPEFVVTPTPIIYAPVTMVSCLTTADALKRTLEIELEIEKDTHFDPGDSFGVLAPNDEELVQAILNRLSVPVEEYHRLYKVEGDNLPTHLEKATSVTLIDLFRYAVDFTSHPRKALFRMLADHTSDPKEKLTLMYICSKQGAAIFNAVRDESPTLLDILETFPSCQPPIERLLDLLPAHLPRFYSISSSPLKRQGKIRFAFNVVEYVTSGGKVQRKGVATPWLDHITNLVPSRTKDTNEEIDISKLGIKVPMYIRHNANAFTLPIETERPLILIGPGTGIAPFIGFLEHRQTQRKIRMSMGGLGHQPNRQIQESFGPIYVYYGFRDKKKDFLFEKEINEFQKDGTITHLALAESRATETKVYVQDLIKRDSDKLYDLIVNKDAAIYICGDAKGMAKGVQDALVEMLVQHHNVDAMQANKILFDWISTRKYLRDLWS